MPEPFIDSVTRRAAARVSRRQSLGALGGAALASTASGVAPAQAGNVKKRVKKKCKKQIKKCKSVFLELCNDPRVECDQEGLNTLLDCCSKFKNCKADKALTCILDFLSEPPPEV